MPRASRAWAKCFQRYGAGRNIEGEVENVLRDIAIAARERVQNLLVCVTAERVEKSPTEDVTRYVQVAFQLLSITCPRLRQPHHDVGVRVD